MWRRPEDIQIPETKFHKGDHVRFKAGLYLVNGDYHEARGSIGEVLNANPFSGETCYLCRLEDGTGFFSEEDLEEATVKDWVDIVCRLGDRQELTRNQLLHDWEEAVVDQAGIEVLKRFKAIADHQFPPPQDLVGQLVGINSPEGNTIAYVKAVAWNYYADFSVELGEVIEEPENSHIVSTPRVSAFPVCPIYPQKSSIKYFMPSNGSQGEVFMDAYCYRCKHDAFDRGGEACQILCTALANEQPPEWIYIDGQPTCTAFEEWEVPIARTSPQPAQQERPSDSNPESSPEKPAPQPKLSGASSGSEVTYSKRRSLMKVSGWIEFQSKITTGKKGKKTYEYYYYRWEEWEGDRLLRTPSKRVKAERVRLLQSLIQRVDMDVRDILARAEDWAY